MEIYFEMNIEIIKVERSRNYEAPQNCGTENATDGINNCCYLSGVSERLYYKAQIS